MSQERFFNWEDDDLTARLNSWRLGIDESGLYRGFDFGSTSGMDITLVHTGTGYSKVGSDRQIQSKAGIYISKQGAVIVETEAITISVPANNTSEAIKYAIISEHAYEQVTGGTEAVYGALATPIDSDVVLEDDATQLVLGTIVVPANTSSLNGLEYTKAETPDYAGLTDRYVRKFRAVFGANADMNNFRIVNLLNPENDQDAATKKYVDDQIVANAAPNASTTTKGIAELSTNAETISGTSNNHVVTPASLQSKTATQTRLGLIQLATNAQAISGISNVLGISPESLKNLLVTGNYVRDENYVHTDNNFTDSFREFIENFESINSDFDIDEVTDPRHIVNRPRILHAVDGNGESTVSQRQILDFRDTRSNTIATAFINANQNVLFQGFFRDTIQNSRNISDTNVDVGTGIDINGAGSFETNRDLSVFTNHNISRIRYHGTVSRSAFKIEFTEPLPDSFYEISVVPYYNSSTNTILSDSVLRNVGHAISTLSYAVTQMERDYCVINIREFTSQTQSLKFLVTGRALKVNTP